MVDRVLQAIAEPHRREILLLLQDTELSASEIAAHFTDVTRPAISQHLMHLRRFLERFWDEQLRILQHAAETEEGRADHLGPSPT